MLEKARSALESFKSQWKSGEHQDDFELSMFAAAQEEYESGAGHKGLLAKIGAETSFDEKLTKASYMKARTAQLMGKKLAILGAMLKIQKLNIEIEHLQSSVILLNDDAISYQSEPSPKVIDDVVNSINRRHRVVQQQAEHGDHIPFGCMSGLLATFMFATFTVWLGFFNQLILSVSVGVSLGVFVGYIVLKSDRKTSAKAESKYKAEIADTAGITRVALEKQNAERQGQLKSLERTEQTIKNLIATRESTASTLEGLFG